MSEDGILYTHRQCLPTSREHPRMTYCMTTVMISKDSLVTQYSPGTSKDGLPTRVSADSLVTKYILGTSKYGLLYDHCQNIQGFIVHPGNV